MKMWLESKSLYQGKVREHQKEDENPERRRTETTVKAAAV